MEKVRIHGATWLSHTKSASLGGDNVGVGPTHFEWFSEEDEGYGDEPVFWCDGAIKDGSGGVAWLVEPKGLHPENYQMAALRHDEFEYVLTYDTELLCTVPNACFYPFGGSWIALDKWGVHEKTKRFCMIRNHQKETMPGHWKRREVEHIFGSRLDLGYAYHGFDNKFDVLAPHYFAIIIESQKHAFYFTEKLIDAISVGCIPIYWGADTISNYFNMDGIIPFERMDELENILWQLSKNPPVFLEQRKFAVEENITKAQQYRICEDWIWEHYPDIFGRSNDA